MPGRAPYAVADAEARREHPEPPHPYRGPYQRDRDRILHCSAFRRLDFKTQVFVPHEHDHFRTRLTHTLEVAQVARTLGRALGLNEDCIEAVALAHDLGHPPFGHGGEKELDELMVDHGHFEHNRQSLRVVDYLEHPYPEFRGLNLTQATRECIARHETRYDAPVCEEFDDDRLAPLEGQLVDLADEIAYSSADLEDALAARRIDEADLSDIELWRRAGESARRASPGARDIHVRIRATKGVLAMLADDVVETTRAALAEAKPTCVDDVRRHSSKLVRLSDRATAMLGELQEFLLRRVYLHPETHEADRAARGIIRELFEAYVARPARLPQRYAQRIERNGLERTVCDFIAGMTDRYCRQAHRELMAKI